MENANGILTGLTAEDKFLAYCEADYSKYLEMLSDDSEIKLYIDDIEINLNSKNISNKNLFRISFACLLIFVSKVVSDSKPNEYQIDSIIKKLPHIISLNLTKDIDILIPDLDNYKKVDSNILNEYIRVFIDRSLLILKNKQIKQSNDVKIGISNSEKIDLISDQIEEMTSNYESILKEENTIFIDVAFEGKEFLIEHFDLDEKEELSQLNNKYCPYCGTDDPNDLLNLNESEFYCYNCEKNWKLESILEDKETYVRR